MKGVRFRPHKGKSNISVWWIISSEDVDGGNQAHTLSTCSRCFAMTQVLLPSHPASEGRKRKIEGQMFERQRQWRKQMIPVLTVFQGKKRVQALGSRLCVGGTAAEEGIAVIVVGVRPTWGGAAIYRRRGCGRYITNPTPDIDKEALHSQRTEEFVGNSYPTERCNKPIKGGNDYRVY